MNSSHFYTQGQESQISAPSNTNPAKQCRQCGLKLTSDDRGIYMKLVTRNTRDFLCMSCLAPKLNTTAENLQKLADRYRSSGECVLFR